MTLTYRGQIYTTSNTTAAVTPQTFTYRGQTYQHFISDAMVTPKTPLVYRGVPYIATETSQSGYLTPTFC